MENNRTAICPLCGRPEVVAGEREIVMCSLCALHRAGGLSKKNTAVNGEKLRELREAKNLPLKSLARELRLTPSYLSMMESGKKPVNIKAYHWFQANQS